MALATEMEREERGTPDFFFSEGLGKVTLRLKCAGDGIVEFLRGFQTDLSSLSSRWLSEDPYI